MFELFICRKYVKKAKLDFNLEMAMKLEWFPFLHLCISALSPLPPPPCDLWQPPTDSLPLAGSYLYLAEYWYPHVYDYTNSALVVKESGGLLTVKLLESNGLFDWYRSHWKRGVFAAREDMTRLEVGYYGDLAGLHQKYNWAKGGLSWSYYDVKRGWFAIDAITYSAGHMTEIELRFGLSYDYKDWIYGALKWNSNAPCQPPGPLFPVPAGLWQPPVLPEGNSFYLENALVDGTLAANFTYLASNAAFQITVNRPELDVKVTGKESWFCSFNTMLLRTGFEEGYYEVNKSAKIYFHSNSHKNDFYHHSFIEKDEFSSVSNWHFSLGRWFAIDHLVQNETNLLAIKLRFEWANKNSSELSHGALNWAAANPSPSFSSIFPPPVTCGPLTLLCCLPKAPMCICRPPLTAAKVSIPHTPLSTPKFASLKAVRAFLY